MNKQPNTDPVTRLHRLYDMKLAQLEQATRSEGTTSLRYRVLAAEAEAINAALIRCRETPVS